MYIYRFNRKQRVHVNSRFSKWIKATSDNPKGSILWPILVVVIYMYIIYLPDLLISDIKIVQKLYKDSSIFVLSLYWCVEKPVYVINKSGGTFIKLDVNNCYKDIGVYLDEHFTFGSHTETIVNCLLQFFFVRMWFSIWRFLSLFCSSSSLLLVPWEGCALW